MSTVSTDVEVKKDEVAAAVPEVVASAAEEAAPEVAGKVETAPVAEVAPVATETAKDSEVKKKAVKAKTVETEVKNEEAKPVEAGEATKVAEAAKTVVGIAGTTNVATAPEKAMAAQAGVSNVPNMSQGNPGVGSGQGTGSRTNRLFGAANNGGGNRDRNNGGRYQNNRQGGGNYRQGGEMMVTAAALAEAKPVKGILDLSKDGHGVLRVNYAEGDNDIYMAANLIRRYRMRAGDIVEGLAREPKENDRYWGLLQIQKINGLTLEEYAQKERVKFHNLTPVYPDEQIKLELGTEPFSLRIIDLIAPIGKGQRSLIVSPPKAGKTTLIKDIATGVARNHPEIHVMAVLVGERPEEVTDIGRHIARITDGKGEVAASNFDEPADQQCAVAELALERAKRMVEDGRDVLILLDSITRLARAYNLSIPTSGRTLSGGFDPAALFPPKKFFGAARNFERPGSLTIIGTALVDTGSRMDDLVYEEFKGTGNQEVHLDRHLAERRIYPGIEVQKSGTRRDDLLIDSMTYQSVMTLHQMLDMLDRDERTETLIGQLKKSKTNKEFLAALRAGF